MSTTTTITKKRNATSKQETPTKRLKQETGLPEEQLAVKQMKHQDQEPKEDQEPKPECVQELKERWRLIVCDIEEQFNREILLLRELRSIATENVQGSHKKEEQLRSQIEEIVQKRDLIMKKEKQLIYNIEMRDFVKEICDHVTLCESIAKDICTLYD